MGKKQLIIGSRSSKLALTQAGLVRDKLLAVYPSLEIDIKKIKTTGDKILDVPLSRIGDKGVFTKEIEEALLREDIDMAVHSMKDLPVKIPDGLKIAAIMEREDPCDILVSKTGVTLKDLPLNSKVGTSSLRRRAQLLNMRRDLEVLNLRGNLDTRIRKLDEGLFDAIIVAYAGVKRLGLELNLSIISIDHILPQAGQGAMGIETRLGDIEIDNMVKMLDDPETHLAIDGERGLLAGLGGGCQVPIGVYARVEENQVKIMAGVFSLDGGTAIRDNIIGNKKDAYILGKKLADTLLNKGAKKILDEI